MSPTDTRRAMPSRQVIWMLVVVGLLVCFPIGGIILGYIARPPAGTTGISAGGSSSGSPTDSDGKLPKPVPGRPLLSGSQAPPPVTRSTTDAQIAPVSPPQIAVPQKPLAATPAPNPQPYPAAPAPVVPATAGAAFQAITYPARHDKHFGGECDGQLTLNSGSLTFSCPSNPGSGFEVAVNQIEGVDDNGVRLTDGKKYHFTIAGMKKDAARGVFADWLSRVR